MGATGEAEDVLVNFPSVCFLKLRTSRSFLNRSETRGVSLSILIHQSKGLICIDISYFAT